MNAPDHHAAIHEAGEAVAAVMKAVVKLRESAPGALAAASLSEALTRLRDVKLALRHARAASHYETCPHGAAAVAPAAEPEPAQEPKPEPYVSHTLMGKALKADV